MSYLVEVNITIHGHFYDRRVVEVRVARGAKDVIRIAALQAIPERVNGMNVEVLAYQEV